MKIRDSVSKETLKQFKSIAPGSNRKKENDADPITNRDWEEIMGTVVFWVYGCRCFGEG
ncbi:hypothetical protein BACI348_41608 [Bacillus altitudinis]|uniref:Uncharacterized protein n=1 Tax=Bacillus altitudinis TaxID=293387 RepID=A0A653THN5_BACAB|nr:hypothetical protein [Bacillus altitudinis]VXB80890.1 hypothetical protein BACI348_41608 [Bacillus altitudinis]